MIGPGKYDHLATYVREHSGGAAVFVIVIDGMKGSGFSGQTDRPELLRHVPDLLRNIASQIEKDSHERTTSNPA